MQFTPSQQILSKLLQNTSFNIPSYQRPYSWECEGKSDQNNQINAMWEDLYAAFQEDVLYKKEEGYFFGSIVVIGKELATNYTVVDGQQRLTSLLLLLTSIKCFLLNVKSTATFPNAEKRINMAIKNIDDTIFLQGELGEIDEERPKKLIIEKSESFNYDFFLKMSLECVPLPTALLYKKMSDDDVMKEKVNSLLKILDKAPSEYQKTALRYFNNRDYFGKQLQLNFLENGDLTESLFKLLISNFYQFIIGKVIVVQLRTNDFDSAYQVFEILNNRGLPLSNKDLFRNFIIQAFSADKKPSPEIYWQHLENNYQLDVEFVSRYVESKQGEKQRKSAFNDVKAIFNTIFNKNISNFYKDIELNLDHYTNISQQSFSNTSINNRISCILQTGNKAITINLLMAIFRNIKNEDTRLQYLFIYEQYALYLEVAKIKRFSASLLYAVIKNLNTDATNPMEQFLLSREEKTEFKAALHHDFPEAKNEVARLFLARYIWAEADNINEKEDVVTFNLLYNKITLEHIIPQTISEKTNWKTDFEPKFCKNMTYKLGNMTLLTQTLNSAAKNYDWSRKKKEYEKTHLVMTRLVCAQEKITVDFLEKRQEKIIATLIKALDL